MPVDPASGVHYRLIGRGPPLMVGLPLLASHLEVFGEAARPMYEGWIDRLGAGRQLCLLDYPAIGGSADLAPEALTPERVASDLLSVADHAGFARFAFFGYSWSGSVGVQLAARTDRLTALAIGGWPPLDPPHAQLLAAAHDRASDVPASAMQVLRSPAQYRQWITWNAALEGWDGRIAPADPALPKLVLFGSEGDLVEEGRAVNIASIIRGTRAELEANGWEVVEVVGYGHDLAMHPKAAAPPLATFLDRALASAAPRMGPTGNG